MRLAAMLALVCLTGCGVQFSGDAQDAGAAGGSPSVDETGGGGEAPGATGTGGSLASMGGAGGTGGLPRPDSLTVCANPNQYGLNGSQMPENDDKLENPASFGPMGVFDVALSVVLIDAVNISAASLQEQACDIVQVGITNSEGGSGTSYSLLSPTQVQELKTWSMAPGHVVLAAQGYASEWGAYAGSSGVTNPMLPPPAGGSPLFEGPFGTPTNINQGGSWQGKYNTLPADQYCALMQDSTGAIVAFSDRLTGDVFLADVDIISTLGGVTTGAEVTSDSDILFANLYAMLVELSIANVTDPCP